MKNLEELKEIRKLKDFQGIKRTIKALIKDIKISADDLVLYKMSQNEEIRANTVAKTLNLFVEKQLKSDYPRFGELGVCGNQKIYYITDMGYTCLIDDDYGLNKLTPFISDKKDFIELMKNII